MTYKHGNWYCKPANEAEAKEIIERAVASGAANTMKYNGNTPRCDFYGVRNGVVHATDRVYGQECKPEYWPEYTIDQLRALFPLPGERGDVINKSSYAKQRYHIGTKVEVRMNGAWHHAIVHGQAGDYIIARADGYWYDEYTDEDVRPLRTEREKWVSEAQKHCTEFSSNQLGKLYDALKSGELNVPE